MLTTTNWIKHFFIEIYWAASIALKRIKNLPKTKNNKETVVEWEMSVRATVHLKHIHHT